MLGNKATINNLFLDVIWATHHEYWGNWLDYMDRLLAELRRKA